MRGKSNLAIFPCILTFLILQAACLLQHPDWSYDVTVKAPTYLNKKPKILYDEAHLNTHSARKTYGPLVELYLNDGCKIEVGNEEFTIELLSEFNLLIISNAKSHKDLPRDIGAFSKSEVIAVRDWVHDGGSLLLIADHHPFGLANRELALMFGVQMGCGRATDTSLQDRGNHEVIEFSQSNGLLLEHPITSGSSRSEKVNRILTFSGQSLKNVGRAESLLEFGEHVVEIRPDSIWTSNGESHIQFGEAHGVQGLSQAFAIESDRGRVVILGEAGMLTAQKFLGRKFGMNENSLPDNKQFALNILHWLLENTRSETE